MRCPKCKAENTLESHRCQACGASLTIAFVGMFLASPLFGLVADLTGSYGASWLGLAGWTVVGIALGFLAREPHEGAKP